MMVTFVSECEKNALNKTRRVLDAFANRIGKRTWQTLITQEGLLAVKKLLRKTASKNTAVACHWIRGRNRIDLLWIVGNHRKFNNQGVVPVNYTAKDILKTAWESDWHYLKAISCLTAIAALFHDLGKSMRSFQEKLNKKGPIGDLIRHEWISLLVFASFVNGESDDKWICRLKNGEFEKWLPEALDGTNDAGILSNLPPVASLVAWLIVTHHKLPLPVNYDDYDGWKSRSFENFNLFFKRVARNWGYENKSDEKDYNKRLTKCFEFPNGLPSHSPLIVKQIKRWTGKIEEKRPVFEKMMSDGSFRLILFHARLSLMLGDHYHSSLEKNEKWKKQVNLYANTDNATGKKKQFLDEHIIGVTESAVHVVHHLPLFENEPEKVLGVRMLLRKSPVNFKWQDKAVQKIANWKKDFPESGNKEMFGFFAVNMASTGCGKTFANAKIMNALSQDGENLRFTLALGLRTLTLQTGDEYRERIGLDDSELAVVIGSQAIKELHKQNKEENRKDNKEDESEAGEAEWLFGDDLVDYDNSLPESRLNKFLMERARIGTVIKDNRALKFFHAPVLACTIDHIMPATECKKGGRYILPALRMMSSDLVIDEIDDFTGDDLVAVGRLIHLAGMLGRKVMISSATIPPDLAQGYFRAYREGFALFTKTRDVRFRIGCAWIDEFKTVLETSLHLETKEALNQYEENHQAFVNDRIGKLKKEPVKRKAEIILLDHIKTKRGLMGARTSEEDEKTIETLYFEAVQQAIIEKHRKHAFGEKETGKKISFGVVRVANITPCVCLTKYLLEADWPGDVDVRIMAYHSRQVLLLRNEQERHLDAVLKRNKNRVENTVLFENNIIQRHIKKCDVKDLIFIVVATPVEEVGRDHDFDWAVVEPSSFRSIIQLAGRVLRHRDYVPEYPNIALMQYNLLALKTNSSVPVFCRPGYEKKSPWRQAVKVSHS